MALDELWPQWRPEWLVYEDRNLVVVDKPAGMLALPTDRGAGEDMLSLLRAHLADGHGMAPDDVAAGVPMDRWMSGLLLFARRGNPSRRLSQQLSDGVPRSYVAGVRTGKRLDSSQLAHRVLSKRRDRLLLELRQTSRRQRIREQLAAMGAAVAGDRANDGPPAWRLMLHASSVSLTHPSDGRAITLESAAPAALDRWVQGDEPSRYDAAGLADAIRAAAHLRGGLARAPDTTAYRLIHGAGDRLPGVTVDRYGGHLVVALTGEAVAHRELIVDVLDGFGPRGIYLKLPPKQASTIADPRREDLAPAAPVRGAPTDDPFRIHESSLPFEVRLGDGLATGLFLDQRDNRRRLRAMARGARVLNLFAYTGAFTVAAIDGGATSTTTVDVSRPALRRAEQASQSLSADSDAHRLACEDAFDWLRRAAKRGEPFDIAVLDPPSFATTKRSRFRAAHDYHRIVAATLRCVAPGGQLLACTNHRGMTPRQLERAVTTGARDAGRTLARVQSLPPPVDFPPDPDRGPHLKTVLAVLADR